MWHRTEASRGGTAIQVTGDTQVQSIGTRQYHNISRPITITIIINISRSPILHVTKSSGAVLNRFSEIVQKIINIKTN